MQGGLEGLGSPRQRGPPRAAEATCSFTERRQLETHTFTPVFLEIGAHSALFIAALCEWNTVNLSEAGRPEHGSVIEANSIFVNVSDWSRRS